MPKQLKENCYYIDTSFNLIFCPNVLLSATYRKLNETTFRFEPLVEPLSFPIDSEFRLEPEMLSDLIQNFYAKKIGTALSAVEMDWLIDFDRQKYWSEFMKDEVLKFNYLCLKLRLAGVPTRIAEDYMNQLCHRAREGSIPNPESVLNSINRSLASCRYWIPSDWQRGSEAEEAFIREVCQQRLVVGYTFNFKSVKNAYFEICQSSFMNELLAFNSSENYLVSKAMGLEEQRPYLTEIHRGVVQELISRIVEAEFERLIEDEFFRHGLESSMCSIYGLYLDVLSSKN